MATDVPDTAGAQAPTDAPRPARVWPRRLTGALTVLAFLAIGAVALYALSLIWEAAVLLLLSTLLAYFIYPLTRLLQRRLKRPLAIVAAYLLVAGALAVVVFIVTSSLARQVSSLAQTINFLLRPAGERQVQPVIGFLGKLGITAGQVTAIQNQLLSQALGSLSGLLPFLAGLFNSVINLVIVITLSVYFILAALPQGWMVMLAVAVFMVLLMGVVLGQVLAPRIFSKTVGVHPIIALFALFAGAELFGLLGGFLAIPVSGVLQQIIAALWQRWKSQHPDQFPA